MIFVLGGEPDCSSAAEEVHGVVLPDHRQVIILKTLVQCCLQKIMRGLLCIIHTYMTLQKYRHNYTMQLLQKVKEVKPFLLRTDIHGLHAPVCTPSICDTQ